MASCRSIEHAAQPPAIHGAAVHAKAHDATGALVHHHEHPVGAQDGRFAPKQIETPQTVFRMTEDREPGRPRRVWCGRYRMARMRRTTSLFMGMPKAKAICCAMRGHPQVGFRCFMSTTAAMTPDWGPSGLASSAPWTKTADDISAVSALDEGAGGLRVQDDRGHGPADSGA